MGACVPVFVVRASVGARVFVNISVCVGGGGGRCCFTVVVITAVADVVTVLKP